MSNVDDLAAEMSRNAQKNRGQGTGQGSYSPPLRGGGKSEILDAVWATLLPVALFMLVLSVASFFLGANSVQTFALIALCIGSAICLLLSALKRGTFFRAIAFSATEWILILLTAHILYFPVVHSWVVK